MSDKTGIIWTDATGRRRGVLIRIARRTGVSETEFAARVDAGQKWCWRCEEWKLVASFGLDSTRYDGRASACVACRSTAAKAVYQRRPARDRKRGWCAPTRDGDKRQARRRVNYLVEQGRIPRAEDLPCVDCADEVPGGGRHEYDHAKGYDGENQLYVEPVCQRCHRNREEARRG